VEPLPFLLSDFPFDKFPEDSLMTLLAEFNPEHHLPEKYLTVLKNSLKKIAIS